MEKQISDYSQNAGIDDLMIEGRNKMDVVCQRCPSKILLKGLGKFTAIEYDIPFMKHKAEADVSLGETLKEFWEVDDIYTFENVGFSKPVKDVKYLICADCEIGPIGWHDPATKKSYIALARVKHEGT